jgi:transcriptional regulator with XRE-family HTH domain
MSINIAIFGSRFYALEKPQSYAVGGSMPRRTPDFESHIQMFTQTLLLSRGLRRIRRERELTLTEMGRLIDMSAGQLSRIENGIRVPADPGLIAEKLDVTADSLLALCPQCKYDPSPETTCQLCGSEISAHYILFKISQAVRNRPLAQGRP